MTYTAHGIARQGVETHLLVRSERPEPTAQLLAEEFALDWPQTLSIHRIEMGRPRFANSAHRQFNRRAARVLEEWVDADTVIITRALSFLADALKLRKRSGCKVVFESHDFFWDLSLRDDIKARRRRKRSARERQLLPQVDGLICLMEAQRDLYRQYLGPEPPTRVIRTGITGVFDHPSTPPPWPIVYVGSLDAHKGVHRLADIAGHLDADHYIHIIGAKSEDEAQALHATFRAKGAGDKVRIDRWCSPSELHRKLAHARWGLVPLVDNFFNRYLTSPVKVFDYYAHGIPVLSSDLATLNEIVEPGLTGYTVDWSDPDTLVDAIRTGEERYETMREAVQRKARSLTWTQRGAALVAFAGELTGASNAN